MQLSMRLGSLRRPSGVAPFGGHATLGNDLLGWWNFEETSGNRLDSTAGIVLTDDGGVGYAAGKAGNAAEGASGKKLVNTSLAIGAKHNALTTAFWYYSGANTASTGKSVLSIGADEANQFFQFCVELGGLAIGWGQLQGGGTVSDNTWYHIVAYKPVTTDGAFASGTLHINNILNLENLSGGDLTATTTPVVGVRVFYTNYGQTVQTYPPTGIRVDGLGLWNRALTAGERTALYASGAGLFY